MPATCTRCCRTARAENFSNAEEAIYDQIVFVGQGFSPDKEVCLRRALESVLRLGTPMILRVKSERKAVTAIVSDKTPVTRRLASAPQAREVVCGGGQSPFNGHLGQASLPEPPHPALLFQDSVDRFDDRFAFGIGRAACRVSQFPPHATMRRIVGPRAQRSSAIQVARQIRVRNVAIDLAFFQSLQVLHRKKSAVSA